ncbi:MAG TPA: hypothetical protein VFS43_38415 [Polyangiaceae bacterium]|nr:hypothetical protein [Polyangiaceae bacterium]
MSVARVVAACTLRVEVYDALDNADERLRAEAEARLKTASANEAARAEGKAPATLDPAGRKLGDEQPKRSRPAFVLPNVEPVQWRLLRNSFRKADEFDCTVPLALLPVHPSALRAVTCVVRLAAVGPADWAAGVGRGERAPGGGLRSQPLVGAGDEGADFVGVCYDVDEQVSVAKVPSCKLRFRDYVGILATKKVRPGLEFDEGVPVSESVAKFLVGSPAEGLKVVWVDPGPEPDFGQYRPGLHKKKKGKASKRPAPSKESYLDAIAHACFLVGVVPRVVGPRLELAFAGTMYEGRDKAGELKATILVTNVVEDLKAKHALVGQKTHAVQVVSFDPDTNRQHTARWPPAAGANKALTSEAGALPGVPSVAANVGLPGFDQLDESVLLVPVAPVQDPALLPKVAESIFLERTRQRVHYTLLTHSPYADPRSPDDEGGALLHLQAGDNVKFGVGTVEAGAGGRSLAGVRALAGELTEAGARAELAAAGVAPDVAQKVASALASTPRTDRFRVDELEVSGGAGQDAELRIGLVTYTVIVSDLQAKAYGEAPPDVVMALSDPETAPKGTRAEKKRAFQDARKKLRSAGLPPADEAAELRKVDRLEREALARP